MDMSASEWTSGCDSGWTYYLDQSSFSKNQCNSFGDDVYIGGEGARIMENDEEEDDLSMVSDASSGPRHCNPDNEESCDELDKKNKRNKKKKKKNVNSREEHCGNQHQFSLDDTASSSVLGSHKASSSATRSGKKT